MPPIGNIILMVASSGGPHLSIPGPYWLFTILQWLTFSLHLTAMNILFGGLLILLLARRGVFPQMMPDIMTRLLPTAMAATITLGVAPLLFVQVIYGGFFYSASIVSAMNWFLLIPVVLATYYLLYAAAMKLGLSSRTQMILLWAAAVGLIYVSYTLTMISDLAQKPDIWGGLYQSSPSGGSLNPSWGQTIFRWGHSIAGALAVAGVVIVLFALYHRRLAQNRDLMKFGVRMFLLGVIKATVLAIIYLFTLEGIIFKAFLVSPGLHAILAAILLNIVAAILLVKAPGSERPGRTAVSGAALVFGGVLMMVIARHYLRLVYLEGRFDPAALPAAMQWLPFLMFAVTLVVGLVVLFWMLRRYFGTAAST